MKKADPAAAANAGPLSQDDPAKKSERTGIPRALWPWQAAEKPAEATSEAQAHVGSATSDRNTLDRNALCAGAWQMLLLSRLLDSR